LKIFWEIKHDNKFVAMSINRLIILLVRSYRDDNIINLEDHLDQLSGEQVLLALGDERIVDMLILHICCPQMYEYAYTIKCSQIPI
jgi:hypothetical protein